MMLNAGALAGYLSFGPLADRFGRRAVFALMCVGSLVMLPVTFLTPRSYAHVLLLLPLLGFFNNGIFSGFPIYLPELYPTRIRATGAGFCFNVGRVLASAGAVPDRVPGYGAGRLWPGRQRHRVDLPRRPADSPLRAGDQRQAAARLRLTSAPSPGPFPGSSAAPLPSSPARLRNAGCAARRSASAASPGSGLRTL